MLKKFAHGYFQLDGTIAHPARVSVTILRGVFGDRIIWPPRSPDLPPTDYYLRGEMKGAFHRDNPHILLELVEAIANFIRNIPPPELSRVVANKIRFVDSCLHTRGGLSQNML
jgi:hypothetical protein